MLSVLMQNAKFQNFLSPLHLLEFAPPPSYFRLQPKIQKSGSRLLLYLLKSFQNCMSKPHSPKLTKKIGSLEMDFCQTKDLAVGPLGWGHQPNHTTLAMY